MASNGLVGELPAEIGSLEHLEHLDLGNNDLVGELPAELGDLANLVELDLQNNRLERNIPPEFGGLSRLAVLDLKYNGLWGPYLPNSADFRSFGSGSAGQRVVRVDSR